MSAGRGRFQDEGSGPDWFAAAGDEPAAAPAWAEPEQAEPVPTARAARAARTASGSEPSGRAASADTAEGWKTAPTPVERAELTEHAELTERAEPTVRGGSGGRRQSSLNGAGAGRGMQRSGSGAAKKDRANNQARSGAGWSSRRKDRDPAEADRPVPPPSREKLEQRAKNILLYHLGRQMQTRSQLADRLRKKEIPDDVAEAVLDRFEELHLLDDASYAETFVRSRHTERGLAKRALGYELRRRGIDDDTATEALSTLDEDQEAATARRLVDSRLRATRGLDPQVRTRRLVGMLARKGYSSSVAFRAVKDALAAEGQEVDLDAPEEY